MHTYAPPHSKRLNFWNSLTAREGVQRDHWCREGIGEGEAPGVSVHRKVFQIFPEPRRRRHWCVARLVRRWEHPNTSAGHQRSAAALQRLDRAHSQNRRHFGSAADRRWPTGAGAGAHVAPAADQIRRERNVGRNRESPESRSKANGWNVSFVEFQFSQILTGDELTRDRCFKFLTLKLKQLGRDVITDDVETFITTELKKISQVIELQEPFSTWKMTQNFSF